MLYSPETQDRISQLQLKEANGTLTLEDVKESMRLLREERQQASIRSAKRTKKPVDVDALLDGLKKR